MASVWYLSVLLPLVLPLWSLISLCRNYRRARKTTLPILISPIDPFNPLWILLRPYVNPFISRLPFGLGIQSQYNYLGFTAHTKNRLHETHGPAFLIVTPNVNQLFVGDAAACDDILKSHREWQTNPAYNAPLNIFGPNIGTAYGKDWQRHRKITTMSFNEQNHRLVWQATIKQTKQMLEEWTKPLHSLTTMSEDANLLALHVLMEAALGIQHDFASRLKLVPKGYTMSHRDSLRLLLHNLFITYAAASILTLVPPFLVPPMAKRYLNAIDDFGRYNAEIIKDERLAVANRERPTTQNLLANMICALEDDKKTSSRLLVSDAEVAGNLFIYSIAGHETSANTMAYAIAMLACYPKWQEWMRVELQQIFGDKDPAESDYEVVFSQLKRPLAIMYETLRLFPPLTAIPRYSGPAGQKIRLGYQTYAVPPCTDVFLNNSAIQVDTRVWGPDALDWRPSRWIVDATDALIPPMDKTFIPWSAGGRICPGRKFAQVEFAASMACLFQRHRVVPVMLAGETELQARERLLNVVADSDLSIAFRMNHPERLTLKWEKCA